MLETWLGHAANSQTQFIRVCRAGTSMTMKGHGPIAAHTPNHASCTGQSPQPGGPPRSPAHLTVSPLPNKPITNPSLPAPFSGWHGSEADADTTQVGVRGKPDGPRWLRSSWPGAAPGLCTQRKRPRHRAAGARLAGHLGETLQLF